MFDVQLNLKLEIDEEKIQQLTVTSNFPSALCSSLG